MQGEKRQKPRFYDYFTYFTYIVWAEKFICITHFRSAAYYAVSKQNNIRKRGLTHGKNLFKSVHTGIQRVRQQPRHRGAEHEPPCRRAGAVSRPVGNSLQPQHARDDGAHIHTAGTPRRPTICIWRCIPTPRRSSLPGCCGDPTSITTLPTRKAAARPG